MPVGVEPGGKPCGTTQKQPAFKRAQATHHAAANAMHARINCDNVPMFRSRSSTDRASRSTGAMASPAQAQAVLSNMEVML